jgi:hypothetical protein
LQSIAARVGHNIPIQELFDIIVGTGTGKLEPAMKCQYSRNTNLRRWHYLSWYFQEGMVNSGRERKVSYTHQSGFLKAFIAQAIVANSWRFCKRTNNAQLPLQK